MYTKLAYDDDMTQTIAITGATGLVGQALTEALSAQGHTVIPIGRNAPDHGVTWDVNNGTLPTEKLQSLDAVIHLAGESVAKGRWSKKRKQAIRDSRVRGTKLLCETLAKLSHPPKVLVGASAIGLYPFGDETQTEESQPGTHFLAQACQAWEAAYTPAESAGIRICKLRIGIVLSPEGGALKQMLLPFKLGLGGRLGNGRQMFSWITLEDLTAMFLWALHTDTCQGAINAVGPNPVTNRTFTQTLAKALHRPAILPAPAFAIKLLLGELGEALLLSSQHVLPKRANELGFTFSHPELTSALEHLLRTS